ncbi:MAG: hypothetical protein NZ528_12370 [Caldilineales bacterium]|nr:hypothetical protein [Caldilineales bacterium]MDW8316932.1 hypothetical protein [Anaerolineae bacterium]
MTELRFVLTVDEERRLQLPEGVPFFPGEKVHVLWDGNVLQVSRTRPKKLSDAWAKVQEESSRTLDTDELAARLARERERQRRRFEEALGQFFSGQGQGGDKPQP